jgi:hypothetical protein
MSPELALAIDACANESATLVGRIVTKAAEVVKLKAKCKALGNDAVLLKTLLDNNKSAIDTFTTLARLQTCLKSIDAFVTTCQDFNAAERVLEIFIKGKFPKLRKECRALREIFCFEATVSSAAIDRCR